MKIAVIGANGQVGSLVVKEAQRRNIDVTEIVRAKEKANTEKYLVKDVYELTTDDVKNFDVVVDALGFRGEKVSEFLPSTDYLIKIFTGLKTRLIVVGGAGSLFTNKEHTQTLSQGADFPESFLPLANAMGMALEIIKQSQNVNWTYISPAADFSPEYEATGKYVIAGEEFTVNENGESKMSYADYALALVDEIENNKYEMQRISVRW
ncbi:dihydrodipicolinate reductase [Companilactobacillus sp. RD055328]|uniref:NAD(P)-dependent oxidoreductase n=1 Tax=Companilactobacillus sp. RD055328 TaxID=2916634 RepID=UPI001FC7E2B3|nr:NAD(P)H-binding protein [Companilactobacillus sp. RD055328]GKQ42424.1 dihydrodipicolinate reductase [Companilactobacillus sp. RD055328]